MSHSDEVKIVNFGQILFLIAICSGRASKRKIKDESEIDGFDALKPKDQDKLRELIGEESETTEGPKEWTHLESIEGSHQKWWKIGINDDKTTTTKYGDIGEIRLLGI